MIDEDDMKAIEKFVVLLYDKNSSHENVNECRFDLFARQQRPYDGIPPTQAALYHHMRRATFQAAIIWGQSTVSHMMVDETSPANRGWKYDEEDRVWKVHWTDLPPIAESCQQLTRCGCMKECRGRCRLFKFGLPCTQLCGCKCEL